MSNNNENKEPLNKSFREPKLRFPEFKDEWVTDNFFEHFSYFSTNSLSWEQLNYFDGNIKNIHYGLIHSSNNNYLDEKSLPFINTDSVPKKYAIVSPGDLILADTSEDRMDAAKGIEIKFENNYPVISGLHTIHLREKNNLTIPNYKTYFVASKSFRDFARKYCEGIKVFSIKPSLLKYTTFSYPTNYKEQEKIVNFLYLIDNKISLLNYKIEALKKYKEGLFKLHFEEPTKKALKEILTECTIKTKINNEFKILSSTSNGLFLQSDCFNHQVASENNIGYKVIELGQLIFSPQNLWLGNINLNDKFQRGIVSPSYKIFSISDTINKQWLIGTLKTSKMKYEYCLVSERGASVVRRNLDVKEFLNIKISIPKQQEQLGNISSYLTKKTEILEVILKNINLLKIYLLKKLFI